MTRHIRNQYGQKIHALRFGRWWTGWRLLLYAIQQHRDGSYAYPMLPEHTQAAIKKAAEDWTSTHCNHLIIVEGPRSKEAYYVQGRCIAGPTNRISW